MNAKPPSTGLFLVTLQLTLVVLLVWPWTTMHWLPFALPILLAGAALGIWSLTANRPGNFNIRPELKANARFITWGPYAKIRHPMYSAVLLVALGLAFLYSDWFKFLCCALLYLVLRAKSGIEEEAMAARFPGYRDYASMTGRFFPKVMIG